MPTLITFNSFPNSQGTNDASSGNTNVSGKHEIDFYQNEERKRQRTVPLREAIQQESFYFDEYERSPYCVNERRPYCVIINGGNDTVSSSGDNKVSKEIKNYKKKICPTPGCGKTVQIRGHCRAHDPQGKSTCNHTGCKNYSYTAGFCRRHTDTPKCAEEGCNNKAYCRHYCQRHGGNPKRQTCKVPICSNKVVAGGHCKRHIPEHRCKEPGCHNQMQARGYCRKHDPSYGKNCKEANCNSILYARGRCKKHDDLYGGKRKVRIVSWSDTWKENILYSFGSLPPEPHHFETYNRTIVPDQLLPYLTTSNCTW